jgi:hypothetical protein
MLNTPEDPSKPCPCSAADLSEIIQVGHEAADRSRASLHTFWNILLIGTTVTSLLLGLLVLLAFNSPELLPLCFKETPKSTAFIACPGSSGPKAMSGDVPIVAMLGLLGGALSAAVFIRGLYVSSTPYNVAIPLALSKPHTPLSSIPDRLSLGAVAAEPPGGGSARFLPRCLSLLPW